MNIIAKTTDFTLSHFPTGMKNLLRSLLPLSMKRALGRNVMKDAVIKNAVITVLDGRKFKTIEDRLFLRVFYEKNYEPVLTAIASQLIEHNDNVVDVGANFGWYSTLFCKHVASGTVTSYEPAPHSYNILDENIKLNGMEKVINVRKVGVGEKSGAFFIEPGSSSESGLAHVVSKQTSTTIETPVVTLNKDLAHLIGNISYIKLDIEGFEYSALKGAESLFKVPNQPIIQIELNDEALKRGGSSRAETITFLKELGYSFYEAIPDSPGKLQKSDAHSCSDTFCFGAGIYANRIKKVFVA